MYGEVEESPADSHRRVLLLQTYPGMFFRVGNHSRRAQLTDQRNGLGCPMFWDHLFTLVKAKRVFASGAEVFFAMRPKLEDRPWYWHEPLERGIAAQMTRDCPAGTPQR